MSEKKNISLVVSDLDNTISDTFNVWGIALDKALDQLAQLHGFERSAIEQDLLASITDEEKAASSFLVGKDLRSDIARTPSLQAKTPEQAKLFDKEHEKIIHQWQKTKDTIVLYDGVLATVNKMKANGTKFVIFTDARESSCLNKLAMIAFPPDMVDKVYVQPDLKEGQVTRFAVKGKALLYKQALGDKLVLLEPKSNKPNPQSLTRIINDMGIDDPSKVVMVGDNIRADGGSGIGARTHFAWQKDGTIMADETNRCYDTFAMDRNYKIGTESHLTQLNDSNRPTEILEKGFTELTKYYRFVSNEKTSEKTTDKALDPLMTRALNKRTGR